MIENKAILHQDQAMTAFSSPPIFRAGIPKDLVSYMEYLFIHPCNWSDGIYRSPLCSVSDFFRRNGVSSEHLQAGLLTYLCLNSAKLGFPLSIILTAEDPAIASHLVSVCKMIAPDRSFQDVHQLKVEEVYQGQRFFENKVIICQDISALKNCMPDLLNLITVGASERQAYTKSKFGSSIKKFRAYHPKALIGIEPSDYSKPLYHPSIIKFPIEDGTNHTDISRNIFSDTAAYLNVTAFRTIATLFERLRKNYVSIPYSKEFVKAITLQKPANLRNKLELIKKVISLCTVINNPPPITDAEVFDKFVGVKSEDLSHATASQLSPYATLAYDMKPFQSRKVDYHISAILLKEVMGTDSDPFSEVEIKVFEAVKKINFHKLKGAAIDQNNKMEKMSMLPRFPAYWAYMHELLNILNKPNCFTMSVPLVEKIANQLKRNKILGFKKGDSDKGNGYFILVPKICSNITLPKASDIIVPDEQEHVIQVLNPLTGSVDEL